MVAKTNLPVTKPDANAAKLQQIIKKPREAGLQVRGTTEQGGGIGIVGGVRGQPKHLVALNPAVIESIAQP